ncbi:MAG: 50S ribosomal protein L3 [Candidatus Neomarinimicrobiota bacterium]
MTGLIGRKVGMTRLFGEGGMSIPATLVQVGPCVVTQVKTEDSDGYFAIQLGYGEQKEKRTNRPMKGHFKKAGVSPRVHLEEFPASGEKLPSLGQEITVSIFGEGDMVSVRGISKGKGFTGVVKRYGFRGGPKTHGQSNRLRAPGSIGQSSDPSRVWPGMKMAGRHGNKTVIVKNVEVLKVDHEKNTLFLKGPVPGSKNGIVTVTK